MLRRFLIAVAAVATLGLGGSAIAGKLDNGVPASSLHGGKGVANLSIGHLSLKNSIVSCQKLTYDLQNIVCRGGLRGPAGAKGDPGVAGPAGPAGKNGTNGTNGVDGATGPQGDRGPAGTPAPAALYGVVKVKVSRGNSTVGEVSTPNAASVWATYSVALGSPVGDNTGGVFRFTCTPTHGTCRISLVAYTTDGSYAVYPRILVYHQNYLSNDPEVYCEYADGGLTPVGNTVTPVGFNIGGSADCGLGGPAGNVDSIIVPAGHYDVQTSVGFYPQAV